MSTSAGTCPDRRQISTTRLWSSAEISRLAIDLVRSGIWDLEFSMSDHHLQYLILVHVYCPRNVELGLLLISRLLGNLDGENVRGWGSVQVQVCVDYVI